MTTISAGRQSLLFDNSWQAVEWDTAPEFKGSMETAFANLAPARPRSVKAADVIAVRRGRGIPPTLLLAEFKNYHQPQLTAAEQAEIAKSAMSDRVQTDVVGKVIDSLAGATFAHDASGGRHPDLERWRSTGGLRSARLLVLLCVELAPSQALAATPWHTVLKGRLRWLQPRAQVVVTTSQRPFTGIGVTYRLAP